METEPSADQLKNGEILLKKLDENDVTMEAKDVVKLSVPSMMPITPDLNRESGGFPLDCTPPHTLLTLPPKTISFDSHRNSYDPSSSNEDSPCTPKGDVFDPFAPGPDKFMLAPNCRKYLQESKTSAARHLNFNSSEKFARDKKCESDVETISDEERLLETVYGNLLEAIVSTQTETFLAEVSMIDPVPDGFKTPTSAPLLSGISETCPDAPVKATRKLMNIDPWLCRKLEF